MTVPLIVLAVLSFGGGFMSVPNWLAPMFPLAAHESMSHGYFLVCGIAGILGVRSICSQTGDGRSFRRPLVLSIRWF